MLEKISALQATLDQLKAVRNLDGLIKIERAILADLDRGAFSAEDAKVLLPAMRKTSREVRRAVTAAQA